MARSRARNVALWAFVGWLIGSAAAIVFVIILDINNAAYGAGPDPSQERDALKFLTPVMGIVWGAVHGWRRSGNSD